MSAAATASRSDATSRWRTEASSSLRLTGTSTAVRAPPGPCEHRPIDHLLHETHLRDAGGPYYQLRPNHRLETPSCRVIQGADAQADGVPTRSTLALAVAPPAVP